MKFVRVLCMLVVCFHSVTSLVAAHEMEATEEAAVVQTGNASVLLINQVRGAECCEVGTKDNLSFQLQALKTHKLSATFAYRYDALQDSELTNMLTGTSHEAAGFLEITPKLASASGVTYKGPVERWYKAGNAYLVGYTQDERKKLIDTFMTQFKKVFGSFPTTTVAWVIDAWSLTYLHDTYKVTVHETTREQWSTDSYTLYGGPVNVPYLASKNWPLFPAHEEKQSSGVLIVRQTLMDPLFTYGDSEAIHTSQPNDYMKGNLDGAYFDALIFNILHRQHPYGFAVIGLETSMADVYQQEYTKQIEKLAKLQLEKQLTLFTARDYKKKFGASFVKFPLSLWYSETTQNEKASAYWVTSRHFRIRLIAKQNHVAITDFRFYDDGLIDPYMDKPSPPNSYWVVPFIYDASRYTPKEAPQSKGLADIASRFLKTTKQEEKSGPTVNDLLIENESGLYLPNKKSGTEITVTPNSDEILFTYQSEAGKEVKVSITSHDIQIQHDPTEKITDRSQSAELSTLQNNQWYNAKGEADGKGLMHYIPDVMQASMSALIAAYPQAFHPETNSGNVDLSKSEIITVNTSAIIGRNPIRIVLYARDEKGQMTQPLQDPTLTARKGEFENVQLQHPETALAQYYIDISSSKPGWFVPVLTVDGQSKELTPIRFVDDCKKFLPCILNPDQAFWYIRTKVMDKWRTMQQKQ